jgi:uncharacterized protein with NRDE domain
MTPRERIIKSMEVNNNLAATIEKVASRIAREARRNRKAVADNHTSTRYWLSKGLPDKKTRQQSRVLDGSLDNSILQAILTDEYRTMNRCLAILAKAEDVADRCANQNSRD